MEDRHDVVVVGLGSTGAATALALADRGSRVLGIDRHRPPHRRGSSHGETRMIREAYFEHPLYVPLVRRAYEGWRALERRTGRKLLHVTGGIMIGPPDGTLVSGSRESAERHGIPCEELDAGEIRRRFPVFRPAEGWSGLLEPRAGYLDAEGCVSALLEAAAEAGASLRFDEPVREWGAAADGVRLRTPEGEHRARHLVLAAGAWIGDLLPELGLPLTVERAVQLWFRPRAHPDRFGPDRCPVYAWEHEAGRFWYGFPARARGVKVGLHYGGEEADPEALEPTARAPEVRAVREILDRFMPDAGGPLLEAEPCLYTNTPDHHFIVDRHPRHPGVTIASACSGHGFKFAPALGQVLADLATDRAPPFDLAPFRLSRFGESG